jgi:predicted nucleic acid-binding protein
MAKTVVLDTNIFLNVKNKEEPYYASSVKVLDAVESRKIRGIVSVITIAEMCSGYYEAGKEKEKTEFLEHLFATRSFTIMPLETSLVDYAGMIRAQTKLALPDAIIVASGIRSGATAIVTHDREFVKSANLLKVLQAKDIAKEI